MQEWWPPSVDYFQHGDAGASKRRSHARAWERSAARSTPSSIIMIPSSGLACIVLTQEHPEQLFDPFKSDFSGKPEFSMVFCFLR